MDGPVVLTPRDLVIPTPRLAEVALQKREGLPPQIRARLNAKGVHPRSRLWSYAVEFRNRQPTAATTRWRVSALPSTPLPVPGVGRPRWLVELIRCRAGESADFELEACDATGHLRLPADLVHRSGQAEGAYSASA